MRPCCAELFVRRFIPVAVYANHLAKGGSPVWQTAVVLLIVAGVLIYLIRHYAGVYRAEAPACSSCSQCCSARELSEDVPCSCPSEHGREALGTGGPISS